MAKLIFEHRRMNWETGKFDRLTDIEMEVDTTPREHPLLKAIIERDKRDKEEKREAK